jgi:hypothetical protein
MNVSRNGTQINIDGQVMTFKLPEQTELYELLITKKVFFRDESFARNLCMAKNPSTRPGGQVDWINKLIANTYAYHASVQSQPNSFKQGPNDRVDLTKVLEMFNHARQHLKRPKITLMLKSGGKIRISTDKGGGFFWLNNPLSYSGTYGRLENTGEIIWRRAGLTLKQEILDLLNEFCANPQQVAIIHGKLSGHCCFCTLPLTDARSLHVGYGEICANHYRMPWGETSHFTAEGDWVLNGTK